MDAAQWPQQQVGGLGRTMEEIATPNSPTNSRSTNNSMLERRGRPQKEQNLNCPRCNSTNTKFCYYNNYSLTQPRYFCKTCRRYWTQGGSLRNVPVGGGSRKNKRSSSSSTTTSSSILASSPSSLNTTTIPTKLIPDLNPPNSFSHLITASSQNPNKFLQGQDLNLAFPIQGIFHHLEHQLPKIEGTNNNNENHEPLINNMNGRIIPTSNTGSTTTNNSTPISALELLRTGLASRGSLNSYAPMQMPMPMPMPESNTLYPSGFPNNLHEFKPNLGVFSSAGDHNQHHDDHMVGSGANNNVGGTAAPRLLFPFADMNKLAATSSTTTETSHHHHHHDHHHEISDQNKGSGNDHHHHHHHQGTAGYWTGMLGSGTSW